MKVLLACLLAISFVGFSASALAATPEVHVARIEGPIDERTAGYVERVISSAEEAGVRAVVLEIDTPGGSLGATQEIVRASRTGNFRSALGFWDFPEALRISG